MANETTLLIHGGCHGAWCWDGVVSGLAECGIEARAFDLPGCGNDQTPRATIDLDDQIAAVVAQVDAVSDGPVRLVGHSIGGWLLAPVASARPYRIVEIVFLAASALTRDECGIDVTPADRREGYFEVAANSPDNSLTITFEAAWDRFYNHLSEQDARAAYAHLTPQPFQPYLDPARVGIEDVSVARRYLAADDDLTFPLDVASGFAASAGATLELLPGDHCLMLSAPSVVVGALAGGSPREVG